MAAGSAAPAPAAAPAPVHAPEGDRPSLPRALLLALLGGLLLNVMPCVLPVLSVKALGFVEQVGERPGHVRAHGLVFAAGVIVAFWAIVAIVLALRQAGQAVGWGFQFQNPVVVGACTLLVLGMSLNLIGLFEVGAGVAAAAGQAESRLRRGTWTGSFASGLLATVIATPCTAPFMGVAVGYAMAAPPFEAFAVFTALGAGMALPFVALLWSPALLARVPRPGPWMETFRQVLSFPLFATAIWLGWVFGRLVGVSGLTWLMYGALAIALAAWAFGRFGGGHHRPALRWVFGRALPAAAVVAAVVLMVAGARKDPAAEHAPPEGWIAWTPTVVDELRAEGRPVFLDFTADWCLTCKVNDATILSTETVEGTIRRLGYAKVVADWTRQDEAILTALKSFGRDSVPLYVVYPADRSRPPEVLPTAITPGMVADALERGATTAPAALPGGLAK
ncbi:MAG: thioredoxin family protein [Planctomycetia bacterium]|nr:thioredoxin family protein [Planctomycetia bacterium]